MPTARQSAKSMFSIGRITLPGAIARVLMETRSHAALPPMTPRLRFQVWVKGITPPSSSITSFPISRRAISPTDGLNAPASETAPSLLPRKNVYVQFHRCSGMHCTAQHVLRCQRTDCTHLLLCFPEGQQQPYLPV